MRLRCWLATALGAGFLLYEPLSALAQNSTALPQPCVDAGATTKAECDALMAKEKAAPDQAAVGKAAAAKAAAAKAAADQAAAEKKAAAKATEDQAAADKASEAKAAADQAAADKAAAAKAAADQAVAEKKAAAAKAAADQAAADKAAAAKAAADNAAADKKAAAEAAADQKAAKDTAAQKPAADKAATDKAAADKAAVDQGAADKAEQEKAAAAKAAADTQPAAAAPTDKTKNKIQPITLSKDCLDAGLKTQEECDASHAIAGQKARTVPAAAAPSGKLPPVVTPAKSAADKPAEQPTAPALPDITNGLNAATKSYNLGVAALDKADPDKAAADQARAKIKTAQDEIDKLCKSNRFESTSQCLAQYALQLSPIPAVAGGKPAAIAPVQPVEVINNLPKGVTQQDVAPLLDSAKDQKTGKVRSEPAAQKAIPLPQNLEEAQSNAALPETDKAAQGSLKRPTVTPIDQQKGEQQSAAPQVQVPQNVTIITQTLVNNNSTTNNTTINNARNNSGSESAGNVDRGRWRQGQHDLDDGSRMSDNPIGLGLGIVLEFNNQLIINSPARDQRRIAYNDKDRTSYERLSNDRYRETIRRQDGVTIVTIYNRNGDILRRSRFDHDGREIVIAYFDDSHESDLLQWRDPAEDLPPLRLRVPARDYVLDADEADEDRVQLFFAQPPVERVHRLYSIDEVKRSSRLRDMVRRLEIGNLTFDTGAATISQDQVAYLSKVARAMLRVLKRNPAETFLIEGHTDAVGSDISNLQLSDARAATVAQILTDFYHVPPENLATQGYGKRYLKVQTELSEPLNRRVTIRRITPLVTVSND